MKRRGREGFTLIELLVTLAIVALLAGIALPVAEITTQRAKEQELRRALHEIRSGIDAYKKASDEGRIRREANATGYPKTLALLEEGVVDQRDPKGNKMYFLRHVPPDPMFANPDTTPEDTWGKRSYASEPADPKEGDDVFDVYSTSTINGLNGVAYRKW